MKTHRLRFKTVDLETIMDAIQIYIDFLTEKKTKHEEKKGRFEKPNEWLQERERFNWELVKADQVKGRVASALKGYKGDMPDCVETLLKLSTKDNSGEYIRVIDGMELLPYHDLEKDFLAIANAMDKNLISNYVDSVEELRMVKKIDVLRLAAYLETFRS